VILRLGGYLLLAAVSIGANQTAWAQTSYAAASALAGSSGDALSQRGWLITPSIGIDFTQTDNVSLQASGGESDLITRISPGIRLQGQSARARAFVDFKLQQVNYLESEGKDNLQRALTGMGNIELVDNWLFVDLGGRISRQAISAFGTPSSGSDSINANVVESSSYQVAPYIQGKLFGAADYMLRFDNTFYSSKSGSLDDTTVQTVQANIGGATGLSRLNWGVNANAQQSTYSNNLKNDTNSVRGTLTYALDPQLRLTAIGGQETNDYVNFTKETTSITGWGIDWAPTERTKVGWTQEQRYFGEAHHFKFTHRTGSTAWLLTDSRDVLIRAPQSMTFSMGTNYDLLNEQLKTLVPDDAERGRQTLALLQLLGLSPQSQVIGGFMSSRASLDRNKEASFIWTGVRNVVSFSAQSLDRSAVGTGNGIPDDFNISSNIRQKGVTANWSHKLTPTASLALIANKSKTAGNTSNLDTDYTLYSLMLTNKLGAYTSGSLGLRRTEASGFVGYVENAILCSLLMVF
jgi:uncharacterized protein (PEP-CTERM system associated)